MENKPELRTCPKIPCLPTSASLWLNWAFGFDHGGADDGKVVPLEDVQHEPEAGDHFVKAAQILVGVGGEHDVANPEDIVGISGAVLCGVRAGDVATIGATKLLQNIVGGVDAAIEGELVEGRHGCRRNGNGSGGHGKDESRFLAKVAMDRHLAAGWLP